MTAGAGGGRRGRAGAPVPPTPERLHARALRYLERFATTGAHLRRVLLRRALRDAEALALDPLPVRRDVDAVVARVTGAGLVDDRQFAASRARRLTEGGRSPARVRAALAAKGLGPEAIEAALAGLAEERADPELAAAAAFARKRRLGPWRRADESVDQGELRARELAAMARAGFAYRVARAVVEAEDEAALT